MELPLDIVYEDDDLIVINKPAGMPIHPSLNNYRNSLANALMYYYTSKTNLSSFGVQTVSTGTPPV